MVLDKDKKAGRTGFSIGNFIDTMGQVFFYCTSSIPIYSSRVLHQHNMENNMITDLENGMKDNMNTDQENNQGCNIDVKMDKEVDKEMNMTSQKNTRNFTAKKVLLQTLGYTLVVAVIYFPFFPSAYFAEKCIIKLSQNQALCLLFGITVFALGLIGSLLFHFFKFLMNKNTIKITRKGFLFFMVQGIISVLFSIWNTTLKAEARLSPFDIILYISVLVGISFNFLPEHFWETTFVEITRRQLLFSISGEASLIYILNFCLLSSSKNIPAKVT